MNIIHIAYPIAWIIKINTDLYDDLNWWLNFAVFCHTYAILHFILSIFYWKKHALHKQNQIMELKCKYFNKQQ